jgi:hypothetical protein
VVGNVPTVDLVILARYLSLDVERHDDGIVIRDAAGAEWNTANGSMLLEGPAATRSLVTPVVVTAVAVYLPLDSIAELAGRKLILDMNRAFLLPGSATTLDTVVRAPAGWEPVNLAKTPAELAEMRRLDGDQSLEQHANPVREAMPPAHETLTFDVGVGVAGLSAASDLGASGTVAGVRVNFNTFLTYGRDGALYRSGHLLLQEPAGAWSLEAGDLLSDIRGLARGVRVGKALGARWHPSIGVYVRSAALSAADRTVVAYRQDVQLPLMIGMRTEATSDGSAFAGIRRVAGRLSVDTFYRASSVRHTQDRGASVSYDIWKGITGQVGARLTTGAMTERWYLASLSVPVVNRAALMVERTRQSTGDTSAVGIQLPIRGIRIMQRYQWTDVAFVHETPVTGIGVRQLQSIASYSPTRRVQLSYQLATQWSASTMARQWTELQTVVRVSRATSLHAVTGFPDLHDAQRLRIGLEQNLAHGFRFAVDYGHLPAFQNTARETGPDRARWLVMVRRTFTKATPAGGSTVQGRVVDGRGVPVAGAAVMLGPYVSNTREDGSYRFPHTPPGDFELSLDPSHLPAQYASDDVKQHVRPERGRDIRRDLRAVPLHAIDGHVYIDRNSNGQFDPGEGVSNVVLRLANTGAATMTESDGSYAFYDLAPNPYDVQVDAERLNRDLVVASDNLLRVNLDADARPKGGVDFRVAPRQKPIIMQQGVRQP